MPRVRKSIFRRREVEKMYELVEDIVRKYVGSSEIMMQRHVTLSVDKNSNVLSDNIIGEYDVELPLLRSGDKFYLENIDEVVIIKDVVRSSNNSTLYILEDKLVETDRTISSKSEAEEKIRQFDELNNELIELRKYKRDHLYQRRFFNF